MTRYRYGDEQHLDESLGKIFMFNRVGHISHMASHRVLHHRACHISWSAVLCSMICTMLHLVAVVLYAVLCHACNIFSTSTYVGNRSG